MNTHTDRRQQRDGRALSSTAKNDSEDIINKYVFWFKAETDEYADNKIERLLRIEEGQHKEETEKRDRKKADRQSETRQLMAEERRDRGVEGW